MGHSDPHVRTDEVHKGENYRRNGDEYLSVKFYVGKLPQVTFIENLSEQTAFKCLWFLRNRK